MLPRMRSVVPIPGGSNQSTMSKYYPITKRLRKLLTFPPPSMRTVALYGVRNSRFLTFNQNRNKKETTTHDCLCEPLVNCEFALRGSDSFRSSEPKETNALNTCNVK